MRAVAIVVAMAATGSALCAASYWYRSAQVNLPAPPSPDALIRAAFHLVRAAYDQEVDAALRETARLNQLASIWTGVASVLAGVASLASALA
jgi:hypothetical protein